MRFLVVLVLIVTGVAGLGLYRGWFHVTATSTAGSSNVTVTVDKDKIHEDKTTAGEKVHDAGHVQDKAVKPAP